MTKLLLFLGLLPFIAFNQSEVYFRDFDENLDNSVSKHNYFANGDRISVFTTDFGGSDLLSILKTAASNGQTTQFDVLINEFVGSQVYGIVTYSDDSYLIALQHIGGNVSNILLKFSSNNTLLWKERLFIPTFTSPYFNNEIIDNGQGGVFLMLSEYEYSGILNIDSNGQIVWGNSITGPESLGKSPGFSMCKNNSGGITGTLKDQSYQCVFSLDNNGQEIWSRSHMDSEYRWPKRIIRTNDGNFMVGGTFYDYVLGSGSYPYFTLYSSDGNVIMSKKIDMINTEFLDIQQANDGNYYVICGNPLTVSITIFKVDIYGNVIDNRSIDNAITTDMTRFSNCTNNLNFQLQLGIENHHGYVDLNGDLNSLCGAYFTPDIYSMEDIDFQGATQNTGVTINSLAHQVLNDFTLAYPVPNSIITDVLCNYIGVPEINAEELIHVYPNPAYDQLTVELLEPYVNEIILRDLNGKELIQLNSSMSTKVQLELKNIESGVYLLEFKMKDKPITKKIAVN